MRAKTYHCFDCGTDMPYGQAHSCPSARELNSALAELRAANKLLEAERYGNHQEIDRLRAALANEKERADGYAETARLAREELAANLKELAAERQRADGPERDGHDFCAVEVMRVEQERDAERQRADANEARANFRESQQYEIDALSAECERLKADNDSLQATYDRMAREWNGLLRERDEARAALATARAEALEEAAKYVEESQSTDGIGPEGNEEFLASGIRALASDTKEET